MKYLKMLGLAAVAAAALMAFVGASSASATVLCKTTPVSGVCPKGWDYSGTIHATLKSGTSAVLKDTNNFVTDTCTESTLHITSASTGGGSSTETPTGSFEPSELTWGSTCSNHTTTVKGGSIEIHATDDDGNGTITAKEAEVTILIGTSSCTFGVGSGTNLGNYNGGTGILTINTVVKKTAGGFLCPSNGTWTGEYVITSPEKLYAATSAEA